MLVSNQLKTIIFKYHQLVKIYCRSLLGHHLKGVQLLSARMDPLQMLLKK